MECHTPRGPDGLIDRSMLLLGSDCLIDRAPTDPSMGCISAPGLPAIFVANYPSAQDFYNVMTTGVRFGGQSPVNTEMAYWAFHNLSMDDLQSILLYLQTVPGFPLTTSTQVVPTLPITPIDPSQIPMPTVVNASTMNGRYLAGLGGACVACHTPESAPNTPDYTKLFAGGRVFDRDVWHLPATYPQSVYATNLTPDATGLGGWTQQQVVDVLLSGTDQNGIALCRPMTGGPGTAHGTFTVSDANDIAAYLLALPPVANAIPTNCTPP